MRDAVKQKKRREENNIHNNGQGRSTKFWYSGILVRSIQEVMPMDQMVFVVVPSLENCSFMLETRGQQYPPSSNDVG